MSTNTSHRVEDTHVRELVALEPPESLKRRIPNGRTAEIAAARQEISDVIHGVDDRRLVLVVGPCSIHDVPAAHEYARRLVEAREALADDLVIVMRTYFEKPRTTVGWTGLVYDPNLDGTEEIPRGLEVSRRLLVDINELGLPCAVELLDPITPQYYADLVAWAAIGARTVESQTHRQLASGLSMPVGFKNATDGRISVAAHAMDAAARPHSFFGVDASGSAAMVRTAGNPDTHMVLRGGSNGTNYDEASIQAAADLVAGSGAPRPIMVDCSHGNSEKDHRRQPAVADEVLRQFRDGQSAIMGLMVESHLHEGRQDWSPDGEIEYGVSITDACVSWETTERVLEAAVAAVRAR